MSALCAGVVPGKARYADPDVFEVNREPAHAFSHVFPDVESARPEPDWENPHSQSPPVILTLTEAGNLSGLKT